MVTKRYQRDFKELERRRRKGMRWLSGGVTQAEVARRLQVSRQTTLNWARALAGNPGAWRRKPLGRPARLAATDRKRLAKLLTDGAVMSGFATELWTLSRIGQLIEREFGVQYGPTNVWLLLRSMGFSNQRPTGKAIQRNEQAIAEWKAKRWPLLKKKPAGRDVRSSSSTKPASPSARLA